MPLDAALGCGGRAECATRMCLRMAWRKCLYSHLSRHACPTLAFPFLPPGPSQIAAYVESVFGGVEGARKTIALDFFRHAFDGSGAGAYSCMVAPCFPPCERLESWAACVDQSWGMPGSLAPHKQPPVLLLMQTTASVGGTGQSKLSASGLCGYWLQMPHK